MRILYRSLVRIGRKPPKLVVVGSNPTPPVKDEAYAVVIEGQHRILEDFYNFCLIDLQLGEASAKGHKRQMREFFQWLKEESISQCVLRGYLRRFINMAPSTYANKLKTLKRFFRDYLDAGELVSSFRFPRLPFVYKTVPTKKQLQEFYYALESIKDKTMFLLFATSGLRRREGLSLHLCNLDTANMMITPKAHTGRTKNTWITFYNEECAEKLDEFLQSRRNNKSKLFPMARVDEEKLWYGAREKTNMRITPQILRQWFCVEMGELGAQDRYIDAFCGRIPKSILARHYTDYSPERLRSIYFKAGLKVFE